MPACELCKLRVHFQRHDITIAQKYQLVHWGMCSLHTLPQRWFKGNVSHSLGCNGLYVLRRASPAPVQAPRSSQGAFAAQQTLIATIMV